MRARLEQAVAELAEAQRRTEKRLGRLEQAVAELAEAQRRTEERLERLEQAVAELVAVQRQHEKRLTNIEGDVKILKDDVGKLKGYSLETRYRDRTPSEIVFKKVVHPTWRRWEFRNFVFFMCLAIDGGFCFLQIHFRKVDNQSYIILKEI